MPATRVGGKNGSFAPPSGHNADWAGWELETTQGIDNDTAYGDAQASHIGSGLPDHTFTASGFVKKGAASTAPGHPLISDTGGAFTALADTGCTYTGTAIVQRITQSNARVVAASRISMSMVVDGALGESWATS